MGRFGGYHPEGVGPVRRHERDAGLARSVRGGKRKELPARLEGRGCIGNAGREHGHAHTVGSSEHAHGVSDPGHAHAVATEAHNHALTDGGHSHTVTAKAIGTVPPYYALCFIQKL